VTDAAWVGSPPIRLTKYIRQSPSVPQHAFLFIDHVKESLYGGAAGGGKSSALLAAALQYVDVPGYSALLLRRTFRDLNQPDALIPRSKEWLSNTDAVWNGNDARWTFPSGATLTFGYLDHEDNKLQYQGAAFQFVGFDELTQFSETQYTYLFSRCRRPKVTDDASDEDRKRIEQLAQVPLRVRSASNPGGPGHEWVRQRFGIYREDVDDRSSPLICHRPDWPHTRVFIPAKLTDNPHLDEASYVENLSELDHHTRAQLLDGDWDSRPPGDLFRREWFELVDTVPEGCRWVRYWDLAATEPSDSNPDPDWTVGLRMGRHPNGTYYVEDVARFRMLTGPRDREVMAAADRDGPNTHVHIEQEPGSAGKAVVDAAVRGMADRVVRGDRPTGDKFNRATVVSSKAEHGMVKLKRAPWNGALLAELEAFREDDKHPHDDQVDALSGAFSVLQGGRGGQSVQATGDSGEAVVRRGDLTLVGERYIDKK
jgi:predicted phage terminase large subunit-like protein